MLPIDSEPLEKLELLRDPYVLVVAADSPFARRDRPPTLRELAAERLIGYRDCRSSEMVEAQLRASGNEPNFVFRSDDNGTIQGLAGAGVGIALDAAARPSSRETSRAGSSTSAPGCCRG